MNCVFFYQQLKHLSNKLFFQGNCNEPKGIQGNRNKSLFNPRLFLKGIQWE